MQRRRFLRDLLAGTGALALAPLLPFGIAQAGDPAEFAAGLARDPWLAGWAQVGAESLGPARALIEGRLPAALAGTLYRNGPAWFERGGFRYEHWFDGDGMVHGWRIGDGGITHRARMVETPKFARERKAGRFNTMAVGTTVPATEPIRNNDGANVANTSVVTIAGRLFALCEAGSAFELSPDTLETLGPVTWRDDLATLPFSAHPLRDADGSVWNFGSLSMMGGDGLLVWHVGADGRLRGAHVVESGAPGYLHAFAMTSRHLVFMLMPYEQRPAQAFFEGLVFTPDQPCRIAVVEKATPTNVRWFDVDFAMAYHFGDAFERNGEIVMRTVQHTDPAAARSPMRAAMQGHVQAPERGARLAELRVDLRRGRARWEQTGITDIEFPLFDPRSRGDRGARLYAPTTVGESRAPYANAVGMFDPATGRRAVHRYGRDILAEEHVFVPRPGSSRPNDGWLVGTLLDPVRGRSGLAVLDAQRIADGPLAQAWLPYTFPLGFHGHFAAA